MILNDNQDSLNLAFKFRIDNFDYTVHVTTDSMKCFGCGVEGGGPSHPLLSGESGGDLAEAANKVLLPHAPTLGAETLAEARAPPGTEAGPSVGEISVSKNLTNDTDDKENDDTESQSIKNEVVKETDSGQMEADEQQEEQRTGGEQGMKTEKQKNSGEQEKDERMKEQQTGEEQVET